MCRTTFRITSHTLIIHSKCSPNKIWHKIVVTIRILSNCNILHCWVILKYLNIFNNNTNNNNCIYIAPWNDIFMSVWTWRKYPFFLISFNHLTNIFQVFTLLLLGSFLVAVWFLLSFNRSTEKKRNNSWCNLDTDGVKNVTCFQTQ